MNANPAANVVLVHGGFVDGSGWRAVYDLLTQDGYRVAVVQNPTLSLQGDAAATRLIIDALDGPVVLVGHSYGGAVITEAGADQNVVALVYVCAFAPDKDESVNTLIGGFPADGPQPPILPPRDGFLFLDRDKFHASFAGDLAADLAAFMADSQAPWGVDALGGPVTDPAWRVKPSWYLVTTEDQMIPPAAQRTMSQRTGFDRRRGGGQSLRLCIATRCRGLPHQAGLVRGRRAAVIAASDLYGTDPDRRRGQAGGQGPSGLPISHS
jgi:pimeloyl-ACP methyl ester carboxylesterase